jgi:hypothetical protein
MWAKAKCALLGLGAHPATQELPTAEALLANSATVATGAER